MATLAVLGLLAGCKMGPDYARPRVDVTPGFRDQTKAEAASFADQPWWEVLGDPVLKGLINEALERNFDVRIAAQRVAEYRARAGIQESAFLPALTVDTTVDRYRNSLFVPGGGSTNKDFVAQASFGWELDLWGRLRRLDESALAQALATEEARRGVFLSTAAQVAQAYFQLRELDVQMEIAQANVAAFRETLGMFQDRFKGGVASALEVDQAQAALGDAEGYIPDLERQVRAQENLLSFLVGRVPGPIDRGLGLDAQPLPPRIPAGLPSALLERRPDVLEAEQLLVSANAQVGVAQANYFPTLSLTGLLGGVSHNLDQLFGQGKDWSFGPSFNLPVIQGAGLKYAKAAAVARWEQARTHYEAVVNGSLREVSTLLNAYQKLAELEEVRTRTVKAHQESVSQANLRYANGLSNYLEVLTAQQQLFPAQNGLARVRLARLATLVQLYEALGGGWNLKDPEAPGAWKAPDVASASRQAP
jgi:multidrug efflux system outer membrane protein